KKGNGVKPAEAEHVEPRPDTAAASLAWLFQPRPQNGDFFIHRLYEVRDFLVNLQGLDLFEFRDREGKMIVQFSDGPNVNSAQCDKHKGRCANFFVILFGVALESLFDVLGKP